MKQFEEWSEVENYKAACEKVIPEQEKIENLMAKKKKRSKIRRTKKMALAAACIGIFACSIVGAAAAGKFRVRFFVDGNVIQIGADLEQKGKNYVLTLEEDPILRDKMTKAEQLGVDVIRQVEGKSITLILGEKEIDITDEIEKEGKYEMIWEEDGTVYFVTVTDGNPEPIVTVTEQ